MNDLTKWAELLDSFYSASRPVADALLPALAAIPVTHQSVVLYDPLDPRLVLCGEKSAAYSELAIVAEACRRALPDLPLERCQPGATPWRTDDSSLVKVAQPNVFRQMGQVANFFPSTFAGVPNKPSPIAATLTSGLIGAGLGYGAGWLGEKALPEKWERGRLRKTLALLGGAAGMVPGLAWMYANHANGKSITDGWPLNTPAYSEMGQKALNYAGQTYPDMKTVSGSLHPLQAAHLEKLASRAGAGGFGPGLALNVDEFNQVIWNDGRVANRLNPEIKGLASGILTTAQAVPGGAPGWVTPAQVGRIAAGMGVGYASGALVGSALGALTGMPAETQERLKRTGMYAGLVEVVIPKLFGL